MIFLVLNINIFDIMEKNLTTTLELFDNRLKKLESYIHVNLEPTD